MMKARPHSWIWTCFGEELDNLKSIISCSNTIHVSVSKISETRALKMTSQY